MGIVASCVGSCCATCACKACDGCRSKKGSLWPYMLLFLLGTTLALVLRYWAKPLLINLYFYHIGLCDTQTCLGIGGANRISFAMFVFFLFHAASMKFGGSSCSRLDSQHWLWKIFMVICLLVIAWLLPNDFYGAYMQVARVVSAIFLLLQLVLLIDFAYAWQTSWTSEERGMQKAVLGVCAFLYAASFTAFVLLLVYFGHGADSCRLQKFFVGFTFALTFVTTCVSISEKVGEGGGLLPAGVVTLYSYWLCFSALLSDPSDCNTVSSHSREFVPLIIGLILTVLSITYASWSVATSTSLFEGGKETPLNQGPMPVDGSADEEKAESKPSKMEKEEEKDDGYEEPADSESAMEKARLSARFHLLMACASMYVCMMLSSWGSQAQAESDFPHFDLNRTNMWIKIATQWVCVGLYIWTLIAPLLFPDREFN